MDDSKNKRKYERYETEVKIYFEVDYNLQTKVEYQLVGRNKQKLLSKRYLGLSRNVSTEGMCFISDYLLKKDDVLSIEVYLPGDDENPIQMLGEVRWSDAMPAKEGDPVRYSTGVKLLTVNDQSIAPSITFDEENKVYWSPVLESIFGKFKVIHQKK